MKKTSLYAESHLVSGTNGQENAYRLCNTGIPHYSKWKTRFSEQMSFYSISTNFTEQKTCTEVHPVPFSHADSD